MGFSQKQAVAISYLISALLGLAAVVLTDRGEVQALIFLGTVLAVGAIGVRVIFGGKKQEKAEPESPEASEAEAAPEQPGKAETEAPDEKA